MEFELLTNAPILGAFIAGMIMVKKIHNEAIGEIRNEVQKLQTQQNEVEKYLASIDSKLSILIEILKDEH